MKKATQTASGRLSQETPAVSVSTRAFVEESVKKLAALLPELNLDNLRGLREANKRYRQIIDTEFKRRGIIGTGRALPKKWGNA